MGYNNRKSSQVFGWTGSILILVWSSFADAEVQRGASIGSTFDSNPYHHIKTLDDAGKYVLEWLVDLDNNRVIFNVTVETKGYVGFGISKKGKMVGADIVMGGVARDGEPYFSDRHAEAYEVPVEDESQDYTLHAARETNTHTFLSFSRPFETCDENDLPFTNDVVAFIWAYGEDDNENYHYGQKGSYDAYILDPDLTPHGVVANQPSKDVINSKNVQLWTISGSNIMPAKDTTYLCSIHKAPYREKRHIIGFNSILPNEVDRNHIHHFLLHRCYPPKNVDARSTFESVIGIEEECYILSQPTGRIPTNYCTEIKHVWAVGQLPNFFPEHVGLPLAESPNEYYLLQMHFNNINSIPGIRINYALEVFNTDKLRKHDAGMMPVGEFIPASPSILVPPNSLEHRIYGHCGSACTEKIIPGEGIRVFAANLHTHLAGRGVRLMQIRNNRELPPISYDDNYNFNFQQIRVLREELVVLPGDAMINRCIYENADRNGNVTVGGFRTRHEMCTGFIWYYHKIFNRAICRSIIRSDTYREFLGIYNTTWSHQRIEMIVTSPPENAGLTVSEVGNNRIDWTIEKRNQIQYYHRYLPQITQCPPLIQPALNTAPNNTERGTNRQFPTVERNNLSR